MKFYMCSLLYFFLKDCHIKEDDYWWITISKEKMALLYEIEKL